jgi:uncharacterized membrane protein
LELHNIDMTEKRRHTGTDPELRHKAVMCGVCRKQVDPASVQESDLIRPELCHLIRKDGHKLVNSISICEKCLNGYRSEYVLVSMRQGDKDISALERSVARSIEEQEMVTRNVNKAFEEELTIGGRMADKIAEFGGSWRFIIFFGVALLFWMSLNVFVLLNRGFDPYPFILLNLVLSCLAAIQAPVIMMSQNRQEARDRLRAENDYKINLKAELEIQHLNEKLDFLIKKQWAKLMEIQKMEIDEMKAMNEK